MKAGVKCGAATLGARDFGALSADDTKFSVVSCNVRCGTSSKGVFYLDAGLNRIYTKSIILPDS